MSFSLNTARKAFAAPILAATTVLTQWVNSGKFNQTSVRALGASVLVAVVVYLVPNAPAAPPAPHS